MAFSSAEAQSSEKESPTIALHARQLKTTGAATSTPPSTGSGAAAAAAAGSPLPSRKLRLDGIALWHNEATVLRWPRLE